MKKKFFWENVIKNLLIVTGLIIFYFPLRDFLLQLHPEGYDSITLVGTVLIMSFLFADFAFTYSASNLKNTWERMLDHTITAIIMFGTGALLEISILSLNFRLGTNFSLLEFLGFLFYSSLVLYDFWDLNRALKGYS